MAPSAFHTRYKSFPSRPHPLTSLLDEQLSRLRSCESASTSSLSEKLNSLQGLHESFGEWLHLPSTQQSLEKENVHELLDASLRLLDICNSAKDALSQTKECVHEIQSILRRRGGCETEQANKCLRSMRATRTTIMKPLKNLKKKDNKQGLLEEVEAVSLNVLESLLSFITCHWFQSCCTRTELDVRKGKTRLPMLKIEDAQAEFEKSESCIKDLEEATGGLFRHLIKERLTLLNFSN